MFRHRLIPIGQPGVTVFVVFWGIAIAAFNHYVIGYRNHWKQYEREFNAYSKLTRGIAVVVMTLLPVLAGVAAICLAGAMASLPD
jgi:hypothetical protein